MGKNVLSVVTHIDDTSILKGMGESQYVEVQKVMMLYCTRLEEQFMQSF